VSFDVGKQRLDSGGTSDRIVFLELDLGSNAEPELPSDARAQVRGNAIEPIEGGLFLRLAAENTHVYPRMAQIRTDFGARDGDEANDSRILCRFSEEGRNLDADRFGDAIRSTGVTQKRPPRMSMCAPPAPYGNTRGRHRL
jgi:hypothetical protein